MGDSTLCVSLPKFWTEQFHLSKGDHLNIDADSSGNIILTPTSGTLEPEKKIMKIDIDNMTKNELYGSINRSYIDGAYEIIFEGDTKQKVRDIRDILTWFVSLELVKSSKDHMVSRVFLDNSEISIMNLTKEIDTILANLFSRATDSFKTDDVSPDAFQSTIEVKKLAKLAFRSINWQVKNYHSLRKKEYSIQQLTIIWQLIENQLQIAESLDVLGTELIDSASFRKTKNKDKKRLLEHLMLLGTIFKRSTDRDSGLHKDIESLDQELALDPEVAQDQTICHFFDNYRSILKIIRRMMEQTMLL
ncbi:hypothetical protein COV93_01125 [Candidatus Woesearchaeota archaeon CG11_big_fil_rev_8_21_14_0_20_43_8]|nr:MAG: hypothetical protein COV93_01125 [Candidatus Woesearchaeota archaeon CG11_big_fil_rev_8_21_14_0_20_43_8]PIO06731.1 MAG: hypothetical protein COT47_02980 [Candidatus Woesearchaeota archaeon CG08_land_8_20_14_0_20_43_7]